MIHLAYQNNSIMAGNQADKYDDIDDEELFRNSRQKLVDGISLKELQNNQDVIFRFNDDYNNALYEDPSEIYSDSFAEELNNHPNLNLEKLREARGAPRSDCSFEVLAADMEPLDEQGYVKKQVILAGTGPPLPDPVEVVVHYSFYKEHDEIPFDSTHLRKRPDKFKLGEAVNPGVIPGLAMAVKSMRKGENSRFLIKYQVAFREYGIPPRIPPKCDIFADVTLIDFSACEAVVDPNALTEEEHTKMTFEEAMNKADDLRRNGNKSYMSQDFAKAIKWYKNAVQIMNYMHLANEEEEKRMEESKVKTLINLSICYNNVKKPELACLAIQEVFRIDPKNAKAMTQFGRAKYYIGDCDAAKTYLLKAKRQYPNDRVVNDYLKKVDEKKKAHKMYEKEMWQRAFCNEGKPKTDKKAENDNAKYFEQFESNVREELNKHLKDSADDFVYPGRLVREEEEMCLKIANDLNLEFRVEREDANVFKVKSAN